MKSKPSTKKKAAAKPKANKPSAKRPAAKKAEKPVAKFDVQVCILGDGPCDPTGKGNCSSCTIQPPKKPAKAPAKKTAKAPKVPEVAPAKKERKFALFFDTETTGLIRNRKIGLDKLPEIVEFYGCYADLETGEILEELDLLMKPVRPMSDEVVKIHGITNAAVANAPRFAENALKITDFISRAPIVIAHNLSYDTEMVDIELERIGNKIQWPQKICTVEQTVHIKGFRLSLAKLCEHLFGERFIGAHRADADVKALVKCYVELNKRGLV